MLKIHSHEYYMQQALRQAQQAFEEDEVPVGAIIVCNEQIIARAYNQVERLTDVTAHAEIVAITSAFNYLGSKYLNECTLYVTLEPCVMCAGALNWAQLKGLVIGARDEKRGFSRHQPSLLHPKTEVIFDIEEAACSSLMIDFFKQKR